jgi:alginate O-acetyltransferase complex protein AlgJ
MGWGDSAGLIEQLSFELQRPMDRIVRNDNGAFATRERLARELARGHDRLAGKRVVVYQFAARELAFGDWKLVDLKLGEQAPARFIAPEAGREWMAKGTVRASSPVPRPGTVPYKDHILALHLIEVETDDGNVRDVEALVYMMSMKDNAWTEAARYRSGDAIRIRLKPWSDVAAQYDGINRSELDDDALLMETPCWGEVMEK